MEMRQLLHTLISAIVLGAGQQCLAKVVKRELVFTWEEGAPNGQARDMVMTNGEFPSPSLVFDEDDEVEITVHNHMHENTTVHWHGIE
jgi:FtsP/CotA-like multicopper oxidase with cupredoxin domain